MDDELTLLHNVKDLIDAQNMMIQTLSERVSKLEDMSTKMAGVMLQLKDENKQLAMGYNDFMKKNI